ncbi:pyridoxal-dependent decarboxylase [Actinoplanes sp. Pm04-4]|uniref:Pyridoxal-dependent decarboxylase n=1 Tax=Paractinoplanes pyxinae TaxID=2997416 RepID=A0ABT4BC05_9ACTN|nr:pyridoxal-dependent decarboxylase [Actinoplanes pyxinae]MCY1144050.1 pyridoxal-dependent decarboxylase [Actinoplanes pyxinae]
MTLSEVTLPASDPAPPLTTRAAQLQAVLAADRRHHLAFPGATDLTYPDLAAVLSSQLLNNVGDPFEPGHGRNHTKDYEIDVVRRLGVLFGGHREQVWGYVASGATEGTVHAVDEAATALPGLVVYASTAAHYSVAKAARLVRAPLVAVPADAHGRMRLDALRMQLMRFRDRPAAIVATVGTTETEAADDVAGIAGLCDHLGVTRRRIHVDAALAGVPRALLPAHQQPPFGFAAGATSVVVSGHKFLSTLMPCAVLLYPRRPVTAGTPVSYIGAADTTIAGSRNGHTPLLLWWSLTTAGGLDKHRARADAARRLAADTYERLRRIGWRARWQPPAFTVTLTQPAGRLARPWVLGGDQHTGRIICMPGLEAAWVGEFLDDLRAAALARTVVPMPRPAGNTSGEQGCLS